MDPSLCANGCGFYGSAANKNLCSKCYKDYLKETVTKSNDSALECDETKDLISDQVLVLDHKSSTSQKPCASESFITDVMAEVSLNEAESIKKKKKRCKSCNRKVGLLGFQCRCGDVFCGIYRYPELHSCDVDFKKIGRQILVEQNPICSGEKLEYRI